MALIKCKNCGKEISSSSSKCIHCGSLINKIEALNDNEIVKSINFFYMLSKFVDILFYIVAAIILIFGLVKGNISMFLYLGLFSVLLVVCGYLLKQLFKWKALVLKVLNDSGRKL